MKQEHIDKVKKALPNWQGLGIFESCKDLKEFFNDKRDFDLGFAAKLIMKFPEFDKDCDLSRFGGEALTRILLEREELIDRCDLTKLRGDQWARLIVRSKHFAEYCIWDTFDVADWVYLIGKREEFADKCDWPMLTGKDWVLLILKNEEFADKCDWPMLTGKDWALLLSEKDGLAEHCDFTLLSNEEWDYLLACKPNYCTHRPKKKSILRLTLKKRWFLLGWWGMNYKDGEKVELELVCAPKALVWERVEAEFCSLDFLPEYDFVWREVPESGLCAIYEFGSGLVVAWGESLGSAKVQVANYVAHYGLGYVQRVTRDSVKRVGVRNFVGDKTGADRAQGGDLNGS